MKRTFYVLVALAGMLCGCSKVFVSHDYSYNKNFKNYESYMFIECERDTSYFCSDIQEAIERQMRAHGYRVANEKPSLLINYAIFYDRIRYQGFNQPTLMEWIATENEDYTYNPTKYALRKGTLMVTLIEAETSEVVWRGYAAGIFGKASSQKNYFKNIVRTIFDQYPLVINKDKVKKVRT